MRLAALVAAAALAGCSSPPMIDGGAIACVRVDALTAQTTTVYIASGVAGYVLVQPDCSVAAQMGGGDAWCPGRDSNSQKPRF